MRIMDLSVDFNALRCESYEEDSRIPEVTLGSPLSDACRRDFTVNSLFFNANTMSVEDFTECGLDDLEAGILRTPPSRAA